MVCSQPPMVGISIRPGRYSAEMLKANGEFVVNLPDQRLLWAVDRCGMISGRDVDKWHESTLTPIPAEKVKPPLVAQCPVNMECVVRQVIPLGSHDLYLGEMVALHADDDGPRRERPHRPDAHRRHRLSPGQVLEPGRETGGPRLLDQEVAPASPRQLGQGGAVAGRRPLAARREVGSWARWT